MCISAYGSALGVVPVTDDSVTLNILDDFVKDYELIVTILEFQLREG